jgi:uncharacterized protein
LTTVRNRPGPFSVAVRDIVRRPGEMREVELDIPAPAKWGEGLVSVAEGEPIAVDVRVESVHEGILVSATIDTRYTGVCGRCLTDIAEPLEVEFQELFAYPEKEAEDFEVRDERVDLEIPVRDAIVLSLPFQPVCQPDCPGLDPATGEPLTGSTEERQQDTVDPRWAALRNFTPEPDDDAQRRAVENTGKS